MPLMTQGGVLLSPSGENLASGEACCCGDICTIGEVDVTINGAADGNCSTCDTDFSSVTRSIILSDTFSGTFACGYDFDEACFGVSTSITSSLCWIIPSNSLPRFLVAFGADGADYRAICIITRFLDARPNNVSDIVALWVKTSATPFSLPISFGALDFISWTGNSCDGDYNAPNGQICDFSGSTITVSA